MGKTLLLCACRNAGWIAPDKIAALRNHLARAMLPCAMVDDLCGLVALEPTHVRELCVDVAGIVACHPRAVRWLLHAAGVEIDDPGTAIPVHNLRTASAESVAAAIPSLALTESPAGPPGTPSPSADPTRAWPAWFPVIDYDRCTHCRQCLNFCLFGVYAPAADGAVRVHQPAHCKNQCPACARICPDAAIVFPKHAMGPINGDVNFAEHDPVRARQDPYIARRLQQAGPDLLDQLRRRSAGNPVPCASGESLPAPATKGPPA